MFPAIPATCSGLSISVSELAKIHETLERVRSERDKALSEALKFSFALSLALDIAERSANASDLEICALIRSTFGERRQHNKPTLIIDNGRRT